VKRAGGDAGLCYFNGLDAAVWAEDHMIDTGDAMVGVGFAQGATMIDDIIVVGVGNMEN